MLPAGVAASDAVLIAGGFSEVIRALPGGTSVWASPNEATQTDNKRHRWTIAAALVTVTVCAACMAVGVSAYVKGGPTAKNNHESTAEPSQLPTAATDEIVSTTEHLLLPRVPSKALAVQESETGLASAPPEANGVAESSISPARTESPAVHRTSDRVADVPRRRSNAAGDQARVEAATPEIPADKSVLPAPTTLELQDVRREKQALEPRANAIRSQMTRLRNQKLADGYDLNQGLADAYVDMNLSLSAGSADLESGDASAARSHVKRAAYAMSVLERLFSENP